MKGLRTALLAAAALMTTTAAHAELILFQLNLPTALCDANCESFKDIGGTGFGNDPRLLTLQDHPFEAGLVTPGAGGSGMAFPGTLTGNPSSPGITSATNGAATTADKAAAPTLAGLGWNTAANVGIGFVTDQTGTSGITLQNLVLGLYHNGSLLGTFALANQNQYSLADLQSQPGNGNAVFTFILNQTERDEWNALIAGLSTSDLEIGLAAAMGCIGTTSATCQASNDGPDSFLAEALPGSPLNPVPLPGAIWLFSTGLVGLLALNRKRKRMA
jgi:hypothetical protein